ncbi:MAG TPA: endolytic transglycosylase MltG [Lachnospiraceae bacterium]|nr:endolytic transglycosylase MltG [Lachnospiraceae bacterium]
MDGKQITGTILGVILKVVVAVVVIMAIYKLTISAYGFGYRIFGEEPISKSNGSVISVAIVEGKSSMEIGKILQEKGLIRSAKLFYVQERLSPYHNKMNPGIYELNTAMTPEEMMEVMSEEKEIIEDETNVAGEE